MTAKKTSKKTAAAKKKSARKKKSSTRTAGARRSSRKPSVFRRFFKNILLVVLFVAVSLGAGVGYYLFKHPGPLSGPPADTVETKQEKTAKAPGHQKDPVKPEEREAFMPKYEVFPEEPVAKPEPPEPVAPPKPDGRPQIAIIIDDLGYDREAADRFLSLGGPLTYAILPHSPLRKEIANAAKLNGSEVMLHLPMEPDEYPDVDPGPGALLSAMSPDERIAALKENLASVPYISGVNNHMGSKMSANAEHMNQILSIMKKKGLFYIDSLTTSDSRAMSSARLFQVPFARRDVFIDHHADPDFIREQLDRLVRIAERNGHAIGIGHPYPETWEVLSEMLPQIREQVQLIPASEAVRLAAY